MKKEKKVPFYMVVFYVLVAFSLVVWLVAGLQTNKYYGNNIFTGYDVRQLNDGWCDSNGQSLRIPGDYDVPSGEYMRISRTVTQEEIDEIFASPAYLMFRTDHTFVHASVNGAEVYRFGDANQIPFGKTPGSGWQLIELGQLHAGDTIAIDTMCPYEKYSGQWRSIVSGTKAELLSYILFNGLAMLLMTVIPLIIGMALVFLSPLFVKWGAAGKVSSLGMAFLIISAWSFTEARTWQLFFINAYAMQILSFVTFALFLPSVVMAFHLLGITPDSRMYRRLMNVNCAVIFVMVLLQLMNMVDFFEMLPAMHVLIVVNGVIFLTSFLKNMDQSRGWARRLGIGMYFVLALCCFCDMMDFYIWDFFGNGFFTRLELVTLLICAGIVSAKKALGIHEANIERRTYEKMAYTDNLTSLRNRRGLDEDLDAIDRDKDSVTIVYGDMNGLKYINDNLGHHLGDEALKQIGIYLKELAKKGHDKNKGKKDSAYRLGGDEYCVLCYDRFPDEMEREMELINQKLLSEEEKYNYPIGISYGIVRAEYAEGKSVRLGLTEADRRMYAYKENLYQTRKRYR